MQHTVLQRSATALQHACFVFRWYALPDLEKVERGFKRAHDRVDDRFTL
jgi:hypothetical protein